MNELWQHDEEERPGLLLTGFKLLYPSVLWSSRCEGGTATLYADHWLYSNTLTLNSTKRTFVCPPLLYSSVTNKFTQNVWIQMIASQGGRPIHIFLHSPGGRLTHILLQPLDISHCWQTVVRKVNTGDHTFIYLVALVAPSMMLWWRINRV